MTAGVQKLGMPKWGLSMTEGKLVGWLVDEGAEVAVGDEVAEVETEKINGVVESPVAGVLRRRVASEGDVVPVGGLLGVVASADASDADVDAFIADFEATFVPGEAEEDTGAQPETVEVGGRTLRFLRHGDEDSGAAEPLVLLHGFGGDLNNWLFNAEPLSAQRTVYALDLPGHGGSGKDVGDGEASDLVDALRGFLDALGIQQAHLAGHSMGGLVAAELALVDPERVRSLALVAPAGFGPEIDAAYVDGFVAATGRRDLKPVLQRLFADPDLVNRQMVDDVLRYKRLDGVQQALEALAGTLFPGGRQARVIAAELEDGYGGPVLVVWGERDAIIPPAHAEAAPSRAETHVLPGVGHSPHMEAAGDVNRLLEGFLAGVPAR
jgi:pyruvate dehydrogenase E2 component (dihydrolipoyllysine-residue acetyltransferase)